MSGGQPMRSVGALAAGLLMLLSSSSVRPAMAAPEQATIGLYLSAVHNLDFANGKFSADFWLWSTVTSDHLRPVETAFIVNEAAKEIEPVATVKSADKRWEQRRIRADLWADWQPSHFPFDTQVLTIILEESFSTTDALVYVADRKNSGIDHDLKLPGWRIKTWDIRATEHAYTSNFGDPTDPNGIKTARLEATLTIQRDGLGLFIDMTIGAFIAFGAMALSFRLAPNVPPIFGARMVITVASLFTVMISMRAYSASYAFQFGETLPNRIHLATLAAGLFAALGAVIARHYVEKGDEAAAFRSDRLGRRLFVSVYFTVVGGMALIAVLPG